MITNKYRAISLSLIFSVTLNIGLVTYFLIQESPISFARAKNQTAMIETSNGKILSSMSRLTFRELVSFLTNRTMVEEGYAKRDLAVAALVAYHHFNLEKALGAKPKQIRNVMLANGEQVEVYPALKEDQFEAIIRFAYQEKWPLTAKGLFLCMQSRETREESLEQAFSHTPEFYAVQLLFQKTGVSEPTEVLLNLISEGSWGVLDRFCREQSRVLDFTVEKRQELLLDYISLHSETAAKLLLRTDFQFALKKLDDRCILDLLTLLKRQGAEGTKFCIELLKSPRSNAIWQAAAMTLYSYVGEIPTQPIHPEEVLARFDQKIPVAKVVKKEVKSQSTPSRYHIVKEGETLWKISRTYQVKVDEIVRLNGLEKDALYPGMTLKLPQ